MAMFVVMAVLVVMVVPVVVVVVHGSPQDWKRRE
jgi:hypothetical protein